MGTFFLVSIHFAFISLGLSQIDYHLLPDSGYYYVIKTTADG